MSMKESVEIKYKVPRKVHLSICLVWSSICYDSFFFITGNGVDKVGVDINNI